MSLAGAPGEVLFNWFSICRMGRLAGGTAERVLSLRLTPSVVSLTLHVLFSGGGVCVCVPFVSDMHFHSEPSTPVIPILFNLAPPVFWGEIHRPHPRPSQAVLKEGEVLGRLPSELVI